MARYMHSLIPYILAIIVGMILLISFLCRRVKRADPGAALLKTLTSTFFVLALLAAMWATGDHMAVGILVGAGLLFGLLGDVWLDLKFVYPADADMWTFSGFGCFLVGHLFYIGAVICLTGLSWIALLVGLVGAILGAVIILAGEKPMGLHYGKFKVISTVYACILVFSTVFLLASGIVFRNTGALVMGVGELLFLVSDLILSGTYFGVGKDKPVHIVANHILYFLGQYTIASGILWVGMTF